MGMTMRAETWADWKHGLQVLSRFMSAQQLDVLRANAHGEEGDYFIQKVIEMAGIITSMPKTYETDGQGDDAIVYLHYFKGDMDWYITEKDCEMPQHQAFGWCDLGWGCPELGYVSIEELTNNNVELDLHWDAKRLGEVKGET